MNKFNDGDLVVIQRGNPKTPKWITWHVRFDHPRRIVMHRYSKTRQHTLYTLGYNGRGVDLSIYEFMPDQLKLWIKGKIGHPKMKRGRKGRRREAVNIIKLLRRIIIDKTPPPNKKVLVKSKDRVVKNKKHYKRDINCLVTTKVIKKVVKCSRKVKQKNRFKQYNDIRGNTRIFNQSQSDYIFKRDKGKCVYCGDYAQVIDHVVSWKDGGQTIISNGVCACVPCNMRKVHHNSIRMLTRALYHLMTKGEDVSWIDKYLEKRGFKLAISNSS